MKLQSFREHRYGLTLIAFLSAAVITGIFCVLFMWGFEIVLENRLDFTRIGWWCLLTTPLLFLASVKILKRFAPFADGAGIPQVVFAAKTPPVSNMHHALPVVDFKTMTIKILTLFLGLWAGASTGREGPTVHVATCLFVGIMLGFRRAFGLNFDFRSAVVAGGAAGLAAAFNTPLAGVTFAIEELSVDYFAAVKDYVLMAIICASIAASALTGEYTYFGKLSDPAGLPIFSILLIGVIGGGLGALFSTLLIKGTSIFRGWRENRYGFWVPIVLSLILLGMAALWGMELLGPGNKVAQELVQGNARADMFGFSLEKMTATLITYWSGIAGGIFAPCLSIGASVGGSVGAILGLSIASCALVGMAAFLSGTIQAPMTAFVIIFEMTGHHQMLIPVMLASLTAYIVARVLKAQHLYQALSKNYEAMLEKTPS